MTTPEQLDRMIDATFKGEAIAPQTPEEKLTVSLIQLAGDFQLDSAFDAALRDQLWQTPAPKQKVMTLNHRAVRLFAVSAASLVALFAAVLAIPPLRTLAQELIVQIGNVLITDAATYAEIERDGLPTPSPFPDNSSGGEPFRALTYEEASSLVPFPIYQAAYIPLGYGFCCYGDTVSGQPPNQATAFYRNIPDGQMYANELMIFQFQMDDDDPTRDFNIGQAEVEEITINSIQGVWVEEAIVGIRISPDGERTYTGMNYLFWEQDGFLFILQSNALPRDEMLKVAESLH